MIQITVSLRALLISTALLTGGPTCAEPAETSAPLPQLYNFQPLPDADPAFSAKIEALVKEAGLDAMTSASENPDGEDEWASICVVDLTRPGKPRVGGWKADNFVYPASSYKMYVLGELIRQVCEGERSLDDVTTVSEANERSGSRLAAHDTPTLAEVLRLMCMYSDNTAANVAIDTADRKRASALMQALGCSGSEITRKFLPRTREDPEFEQAPGTVTSALHMATFLYAVESGAIGKGRGRGLIKGYLATNVQNKTRVRAGVPDSATVFSKTGEWNIFTAEGAMVEDGPVKYLICVLTPHQSKVGAPRIAQFTRGVHALIRSLTEQP